MVLHQLGIRLQTLQETADCLIRIPASHGLLPLLQQLLSGPPIRIWPDRRQRMAAQAEQANAKPITQRDHGKTRRGKRVEPCSFPYRQASWTGFNERNGLKGWN